MSHLIRQTHRWTSILFTLIVAALFAAQGLTDIRILPDLDGRDRVVSARKPQDDTGCGTA